MRHCALNLPRFQMASMKVPPKRKGNVGAVVRLGWSGLASMKVPPKRKGNLMQSNHERQITALNESPSEKEGKCVGGVGGLYFVFGASMKVPPKRKGNQAGS